MAESTVDDVKVEDENDSEGEGEEEKEPTDKEEEVVPVRKSVINAQRRIIEKQGKKLAETSKDDDEELTPQARKLIEQEVAKATGPLHDELAFRDYFSQHPEDRKFEKQARARFDAWGSVPIEEVMKTLRVSTSEDRTKAEEKVTRATIKGGTTRPTEERVASTEADFKKVYEQVKRGDKSSALKALGIKN